MRILIVSYWFPPAHSIASLRPYYWARCWAEAGHEVTVLTAAGQPNTEPDISFRDSFPFTVVRLPFFNPFSFAQAKTPLQSKTKGRVRGRPPIVRVILERLNRYIVSHGALITCRMPDYSDFWIRPALRWANSQPEIWDWAVSTYGPYASHLIAAGLKRRERASYWCADYRDLWTDNHIFPGFSPLAIFERRLENRAIAKADLVTTVSAPLCHRLSKRFPSTRVSVIENGFDSEELRNLNPENAFPNDGKIRIVYTGTIYEERRDPSPLFEAIAEGARNRQHLDRLEVIFCGANAEVLDRLVKKWGVERWVRNIGLVPRETALRMQRDCSILLFLEWEGPEVDGITTGKLFEYISSGTEIWAVGISDKVTPGKLLCESGAGKLFGKDTGAIRRELSLLLDEDSKRKSVVPAQFLSRFDRKRLAEQFLGLISHS